MDVVSLLELFFLAVEASSSVCNPSQTKYFFNRELALAVLVVTFSGSGLGSGSGSGSG